jgi:hypothetical protein
MPKALLRDATSLQPGPADVPTAQAACTGCGQTYSGGQHTCLVGGHLGLATAPLAAGLGTREEIQAELDGIAQAVRSFPVKQPDQIMRECAAYTARLTELCVLLHRVEALDRQYLRVRTQQVERWQHELEFQFKVASRLVEVMRQDIALLGGQP